MKYKNNQSVLIVIYAEDTRRVLMLQRRDDPDFWQSVTGSLEMDETPTETAIRELWEEVRLEIEEHWFLLAVEQEFTPELTEHLAFQWVSPAQAIQMTKSPNNAEAIRKYLL